MISRFSGFILIVVLVLVGCDNRPPPTPALRGAFVPTRVTPTPTHTLTPTPTIEVCTPRTDWTISYVIAVGDTLGNIAQRTNSTVPELQEGNCLPDVNSISVGQILRLPSLPQTPTATSTDLPTETPLPTETETPEPQPSDTATPFPIATGNSTQSAAVPTITFDTTDAKPLTYGDTVEGTIEDAPVIYVFDAAEGDLIDIQMTKTEGDLDTLLLLLNADNTVVAQNDDISARGNSNSLVNDVLIPADGQYIIVAWRFQRELGTTSGSYELSLRASDADVLTAAPEMILYGETIEGEITDENAVQVFIFEANAGDIIDIRMNRATEGDLDPLLALEDANGNELATNDDINTEDRNSYIREFSISEDGEYRIIATRVNRVRGRSEGEFILSLGWLGIDDTLLQNDAILIGSLEFDGELVEDGITTGFISDSKDFYRYPLEVEEPETSVYLSISRESGDLEPYLSLVGPDGREIARAGSSLGSNRRDGGTIDNILLTKPDTYIIVVARSIRLLGESRNGGFNLYSLNPTNSETSLALVTEPIQFGIPTNFEIVSRFDEEVIYTFYGYEGDQISVDLSTSEGLSVVYAITNPLDASVIATGQESSEAELPADGYYSLTVRQRRGAGIVTTTVTRQSG